jgi:acyl-CoA reductase-like NAD-dependent aldehyde dehydrogenase
MAPWNYPVNLAIVPLVGAIAAGNTAFVKFSRQTSRTGTLMCSLLQRYLDPTAFAFEAVGR